MAERRAPFIRSFATRSRRRAARIRSGEVGPAGDDGVPTGEAGEGRRHSVVDSAVYVDGARVASPRSLAECYQALRAETDGTAWIGLYRPSEIELASVAAEFSLHELALEDAIVAHQRPKL